MRFSFCCGSGICCALVSAVFWLGGGLVGQAIAQTAPPALVLFHRRTGRQ